MLNAFRGGLILLFLLAGCAQMPGGTSGGRGIDHERLSNAIAIDDVDFVRDAVQSGRLGINQTIAASGFPEGAPIILVAARSGALKTLRFLISSGANLNAQAVTGETALMMASYFAGEDGGRAVRSDRHEEAVRLLVESGASLENAPHHYTPLGYAAYRGHDRIVRYLIERGARVDADARDGTVYVNTPLMMASIQGHTDTAMWLLRAGADARVRIYLGSTAAELAQKNRHENLAGLLRCAESAGPGPSFSQRCGR
jgi:uncharacterized protein